MCVCRVLRHTRPDHPSSTILHGDRARPSPRERKRFLARPREREREGDRKKKKKKKRERIRGEREREKAAETERGESVITREWQRLLITLFVPFLRALPTPPLLSSLIAARIDEGGPFRKAKLYARESGEHRAEKCSARTSERASVQAAVQSREERSSRGYI